MRSRRAAMRRRSPAIAVLCLCLMGLADAAPSLAAPTDDPSWGPVVTLSPVRLNPERTLAASSGPSRVVAAGWEREERDGTHRVVVSLKTPRKRWSEPKVLGVGSVAFNSRPWLTVAGDGGITVVWNKGRHVFARFKPPGRAWQPKTRLNPNPTPASSEWYIPAGAASPTVAVNAAGDAVAAWDWCYSYTEFEEFACYPYTASKSGSGEWLTPQRHRLDSWFSYTRLTLDRDGVSRRYWLSEDLHALRVARGRPGRGFGPPRRLASGPWFSFDAVGNPAGDQLVVVRRGSGVLLGRTKHRGRPWTALTKIDDAVGYGGYGDDLRSGPVIDGRGRGGVAYVSAHAAGVQVASVTPRGTWSPVATVGSATRPRAISLAVNRRGDRVLAWAENVTGQSPRVLTALQAPGLGWSSPVPLTPRSVTSVGTRLAGVVRYDGAAVVGWVGAQGSEPVGTRRFRVRESLTASAPGAQSHL